MAPIDHREKKSARSGKLPKAMVKNGRKKAFTLRLDPPRHLRLRMATTVENMSAQQLVTRAVDEYLKKIPGLEQLVAHVATRKAG